MTLHGQLRQLDSKGMVFCKDTVTAETGVVKSHHFNVSFFPCAPQPPRSSFLLGKPEASWNLYFTSPSFRVSVLEGRADKQKVMADPTVF